MGQVVQLFDRLMNVMSGRGTTADKRSYGRWYFAPVTPDQVENSYRTSWLMRKIVDIPPLDMVRAWRSWQAEKDAIEAIEREEKRLGLKHKTMRALTLARLWGGSAIILGIDGDDPSEPLDLSRLGQGSLDYLHVVSKNEITATDRITDPGSPFFNRPAWYSIGNGRSNTVLHPSRVVEFIGQPAPEGGMQGSTVWPWGDPLLQSIEDAVKDAEGVPTSFAALCEEAKYDIIGIPDLTSMVSTEGYEERLMNRLAAASLGKSNHRALIRDANETWEQRQVTWSGMPEMMFAVLQIAAGAADIPITRLLGQSPKGLQSSGEGEERDYHSMIEARQDELLAPALDRIDEVLIRSALGERPPEVHFRFNPLTRRDPDKAAEREKKRADTFKTISDTGLVEQDVLSTALKNAMIESGEYPGIETAIEEAEAAAGEEPIGDPDELLVEEIEERGDEA